MTSLHRPGQAALRLSILILAVLIAGCTTRSISDSGYRANALYSGELSEFDIIGTAMSPQSVAAGEEVTPVRLGGRLLVIQSGALIPDPEFTGALERDFDVAILSGVPGRAGAGRQARQAGGSDYAEALFAAARTGRFDTVIVYWGVIESGAEKSGLKAISWTPIVGGLLKDERQTAVIRLKILVVDVATGLWDSFSPESFSTSAWSSRLSRAEEDQKQVMELKSLVYEAAVRELIERYGG